MLGPVCFSIHREKERGLPVAVCHGILGLLLLKELSDGEQLLKHVLQETERNKHPFRVEKQNAIGQLYNTVAALNVLALLM